MPYIKTLASALLIIISVSPAFAEKPGDRGPTPGLGWGPGGSHGPLVGAPGPIAGVGLPILAAAGALVWIRRERRNKAAAKQNGAD